MNRTAFATSVTALALLFPDLGSADANPNFSGTWVMDATRSESAHSNAGSKPVTLVIKQTATEVSIETRRGDQSETLVYKMDGSETEKPAGDNGPFLWRVQWERTKLVTETHRNINRATVTIKEVLSLNGTAKEMTVDRTLTVQHGYTMRGAQNYSSAKDIFVKTR
jgi:hypothetical protein